MKILSMIFCLIAFSITPAFASTLSGKVVSVADGDTITVLTSEKVQIKVRLKEIDAPEKDQPYGQKSKEALSNLIFGKNVSVEWSKTDKYGRILGRVFFEKVDINLQLVKGGYAWAYTQYLTDELIKKAETEARSSKIGLWALQADQIIPPWQWRHGVQKNTKDFKVSKPSLIESHKDYHCGDKTYCREMNSCKEARFYLETCGLARLDGDRDGVPCENLCR